MSIGARLVYLVALLTMWTLPFNPLLNQRSVVLPLTLICVVLGLVSMYICTLPNKQKPSGNGGGK